VTNTTCQNCGGQGYTSEAPRCPACDGTGRDTSRLGVTGTCAVCGTTVPWRSSTLDSHPAPEGADPADPAAVRHFRPHGEAPRPRRYDRERWMCAGSLTPPAEAQGAKARKMTAAERKLSRDMFGGASC